MAESNNRVFKSVKSEFNFRGIAADRDKRAAAWRLERNGRINGEAQPRRPAARRSSLHWRECPAMGKAWQRNEMLEKQQSGCRVV